MNTSLTPAEIVNAIRNSRECSLHAAKVLFDEFMIQRVEAVKDSCRKTLRDEFAQTAMLCGGPLRTSSKDFRQAEIRGLAKEAYQIADAMLEARES